MPEAPIPEAPLSAFASVRMIALPVQMMRAGDAMGWSVKAGEPKAFLARADSAIEAALRDRGLDTQWAFPSDLARTAQRNPMHAVPPARIRAGDAVRVMERRKDAEIPEPVASQIRALAAFHDTRHALVPVEIRFERAASGTGGHGVLRIAVLDVRASRLVFTGNVVGADVPEFSESIVTGLATQFADLIVAR